MRRLFVVLDIKDEYDGDKEDVAMWVNWRLGVDHPVEATVYQSIQAMQADELDGMGAWG